MRVVMWGPVVQGKVDVGARCLEEANQKAPPCPSTPYPHASSPPCLLPHAPCLPCSHSSCLSWRDLMPINTDTPPSYRWVSPWTPGMLPPLPYVPPLTCFLMHVPLWQLMPQASLPCPCTPPLPPKAALQSGPLQPCVARVVEAMLQDWPNPNLNPNPNPNINATTNHEFSRNGVPRPIPSPPACASPLSHA